MKYDSVGRAIRAAYRCDARVIRGEVPSDCRAPIFARLDEDLARADRFGPCPGTNDVTGGAPGCTASFVFGEEDELTCRLAKLRAAEAKSIGKLDCYRESLRTGKPLDECSAAVDARFLAAFAQLERNGVCDDPFSTAEAIESRVDQCVFYDAVPLSCGNGQIDPGEQCDGQPFCQPFVCRILLPQCCQFGSPPNALCVATDVAIELCLDNGGSPGVGFCPDNPCPDLFPGCMVGACGDPPIADTRVCCLLGNTCQGSSVGTTLGLRSALLACSNGGGTAVLGTCGVDGSCIRD